MTLELLIETGWKSAVVAALALLALTLAERRPAAERAWIAQLGIVLSLVVPAFAAFGPNLEFVAPWLEAAPMAAFTESSATSSILQVPLGELPTSSPAAASFSVTPSLAAVVLYGAVAAALLLALAIGVTRLVILQARAAVLTEQAWLSALAHAQVRMGFKHGAALLVSDELESPVSWGFFRPTILLTRKAVSTPEQAEAIISHELAHVVRLDWANLLLARIGAALLWFNPLVWLLAHQAHQLREEAADDAVLRGNVSGPDYATLLLGVARHDNRGALLAANGVAPGRHSLKRRLVRVLDAGVRRDAAKPAWRVAVGAAALGVAGPLAAFTPLAAPPIKAAPSPAAVFAHQPPAAPEVPAALPQAAPLAIANAREAAPAEKGAVPAATSLAEVEALPVAAVAPAPEKFSVVAQAPVVQAPRERPQAPVEARRPISPDMLLQMSIHGVTPEWIASLEPVLPGVRRWPPEQLVAMGVHRVEAGWLRDLAQLGYRDLTYNQVITMAIHRVNAAYVRDLASAGYRNLSVDELVSMRIHRVNGDYVRGLAAEGLDLRRTDRAQAGPAPPDRAIRTP